MEEFDDEDFDKPKKPETRGGYRKNAGRPKGSKSLLALPKKTIMEYTSEQELRNMVERSKRLTRKDPRILQWYLEMCMGKPKVVEREGGGKTVNNIALFLDNLEKQKLDGPTTIGQVVEIEPPVSNQGQEPEQDTVQTQ
jgi:hypothetical protein